MDNDCPYCGKGRSNFGDDDEGVWMWIDNTISDAPMITDEERREIANELRRQAAYSSGSLGEWWQRLQEIVTGEVDFANPQETYRAIADLIDRPSENTERPR